MDEVDRAVSKEDETKKRTGEIENDVFSPSHLRIPADAAVIGVQS